MSYPRCVDSVSIRILWLRSTKWHSRLGNVAIASERSIFSIIIHIEIYIYIYKKFPCRGEHIRIYLYFGVYKHVTESIRNIARGVDIN